MTAQFSDRFGVYRSEWPSPTFVRVDIDHVHQSTRDGEITAEARIISTAPPPLSGLIHQARFTLTGTRSRADLARHCATRTPGQDIDWPGLIEWASVKTIAAFRQGEPPVYLTDATRPDDDGYLVPPLVLGRLPTVWFGDGGTGKSLLALAAGISVHTGENVLGAPPSALRKVAIFDWEMDAWEHRKRLAAICGNLGVAPPKILYVPCRAAIWDDLDRLRRVVAEHEVGFVIVDSVGMACAGVPLVADEAPLRFYTALRQIGLGALCLAHRTKAEDGDQYPFGSAFWHNQARSTWFIRKAQDPGDGSVDVALHHRKANTGKLEVPIGFRITFKGDEIEIGRRGAQDSALLMESAPVGMRMRGLLKAGPMGIPEIAAELGVSEPAVRSALNRGKEKGTFTETLTDGERKVWLASNG